MLLLGDNIKFYRKLNKVSQLELAESLDVNRSAVSMWECNKRLPDILTLKKICEYLNVSMDIICNVQCSNIKKDTEI